MATKRRKKPTLSDFLHDCPAGRRRADRVKDDDLRTWIESEVRGVRESNRWAFHIGRVLLHRRQDIAHGDVNAWEERVATALGRSTRSIRLYLQVAGVLQDELATRLPIHIIDRPFRDIPRAIRRFLDGDADETEEEADDNYRVEAWLRDAGRTLRVVGELPPAARGDARVREVAARMMEVATDILGSAQVKKLPGRKVRRPVVTGRVPTFLPFPGTKVQLAPLLASRLAPSCEGREYREPYLGSGAVLLTLLKTGQVERVRINDADPAVAAVWNAVIREPEKLVVALHKAQVTKASVGEAQEALREGSLRGIELAVASLVAHHSTPRYLGPLAGGPSAANMARWNPDRLGRKIDIAHRLLKGRVRGNRCTHQDGVEVIRAAGEALLYLDPPYASNGAMLYHHSFTDEQHKVLAQTLRETRQPWLLSYDDSDEIRRLYDKEVVIDTDVAYRSWAAPGAPRKRTPELLICPAAYRDILVPPVPGRRLRVVGSGGGG